jgi:hypothetical protein
MLAVGKFLSSVIFGLAVCLSLGLSILANGARPATGPLAWWDLAWPPLVVPVSLLAAVVVHECGHLLACLALRVKVRGFQIGRPDRGAYRFQVRGVRVALGLPYGGRVEHGPVSSRWRAAMIVMAGSLANLIVAGALLAAGLATGGLHLSGTIRVPQDVAVELSLAVFIGAMGISNLLPFRVKRERLSDGARLLALGRGRLGRSLREQGRIITGPDEVAWRPATPQEAAELKLDYAAMRQDAPGAKLPPELVDKWLAAFHDRTFVGLLTARFLGRPLRMDGRISELLRLFEEYPALPYGRLTPSMLLSMGTVAYEVALVPRMSHSVMDVVVDRLQWLIDVPESASAENAPMVRAGALHSMAVARLRQGKNHLVEDLCLAALAGPELSPADRAAVLATAALARQALGQPYEKLLDEATALDPDADLVAEASSVRLAGPGAGSRKAGAARDPRARPLAGSAAVDLELPE